MKQERKMLSKKIDVGVKIQPNPKILVVDDESATCEMLSDILELQGYDTDTSEDGVAALEKIKDGNFNIVISDLKMPRMDGHTLLKNIKKGYPNILVVIMTAYGSLESAVRSIREGAYDYITKPINSDLVVNIIKRGWEKMRLEMQTKLLLDKLQRTNVQLLKTKEEIEGYSRTLEQKVAERTKELEDAKTHLEERVKERTQELIQTQEQLIQSEKLSAVGKLASGIAHGLRNPFAIISSSAQFCKGNYKLDSDVRENLDVIIRNIGEANKIIKELLDFAKPKSFDFKQINIEDILNKILDLIKTKCESQRILIEKEYSNIQDLLISRAQMEEALMNFLLNAIEAMPEGGTLKVKAENIQNNKVIIQIVDTGKGIPGENIRQVLDPFFTTKAEGVGLGLSLAHQIVSFHKGDFFIQSREGKGTTIKITLPVVSKEELSSSLEK